ncbi:hypothetical protein EVG20_g6613 [Dentipellis fragilis]|uniref:Transcription initiation factor TFIID subunit 4 n=1 Tax=Dentipellis fragilis TaxID=205917 RepID=A0A4Y9YNV8_9AGAM|nr:hypothetical protein EVG20_g6613 [Dentipellis fragilis]
MNMKTESDSTPAASQTPSLPQTQTPQPQTTQPQQQQQQQQQQPTTSYATAQWATSRMIYLLMPSIHSTQARPITNRTNTIRRPRMATTNPISPSSSLTASHARTHPAINTKYDRSNFHHQRHRLEQPARHRRCRHIERRARQRRCRFTRGRRETAALLRPAPDVPPLRRPLAQTACLAQNFETRFLGPTMRKIGTRHRVTKVPEDSVNYVALALRARLSDLITGMIAASTHRTSTQFDREPSLYEDGTPMWGVNVRQDVAKQLAALEKGEREEEMRVRRERKELAAAQAAALATHAAGAAGLGWGSCCRRLPASAYALRAMEAASARLRGGRSAT